MKDSGVWLIVIGGAALAYYLYTQTTVQGPSSSAITSTVATVEAATPSNQGGSGAAVEPILGPIAAAPVLAPDPSLSGLASYYGLGCFTELGI